MIRWLRAMLSGERGEPRHATPAMERAVASVDKLMEAQQAYDEAEERRRELRRQMDLNTRSLLMQKVANEWDGVHSDQWH